MKKKVRCIDNSSVVQILTVGLIYEVKEEHIYNGPSDIRYVLVGIIGGIGGWAFRANRFVVVSEDEAKPNITQTSSPTKEKPDNLLLFFKQVGDGMCACNMPKAQCTYHKGV